MPPKLGETMRRPTRDEVLHGTRHGQLSVDARLTKAYALTDREAAVAALLTKGLTGKGIAKSLGIASSTAGKHLGSLRRKLGVHSTTEAAAKVASFSLQQAEGTPSWPLAPPHDPRNQSAGSRKLAEALGTSVDVEAAVAVLRDHLFENGVEAAYFVFLPMAAFSFRAGSYIEAWAAPAQLIEAHSASGGFAANPLAHKIFAEPDRDVLLDIEDPESLARIAPPEPLVDVCRSAGVPLCIAFAVPFGCGFVATAMFLRDEARVMLRADREGHVSKLRSALLITQSSLFARGQLAKTAALTLRERNALTLMAQGLAVKEAARQLGTGERVFAQLLKSARTKLGATTNTEATARAMALNALVFL